MKNPNTMAKRANTVVMTLDLLLDHFLVHFLNHDKVPSPFFVMYLLIKYNARKPGTIRVKLVPIKAPISANKSLKNGIALAITKPKTITITLGGVWVF